MTYAIRPAIAALLLLLAPYPVGHAQEAPAPSKPAFADTTMSAEAFATAAAMSDKFEVDTSKLAIERTKRDDVAAFAKQMVADHTESYEALAAAAREDKLNVPLPPKFDAKHLAVLEGLHAAAQEDFDIMYLDSQLNGHRSAADLFKKFAASGSEGAMVKFARATLPKIQEHLDHIEAMHKASVIGMR